MARKNPSAQTAFGPIVLAAVEQHEPAARRLVDDDLAPAFLPVGLRRFARATAWPLVKRAMVGALERTGPGLFASLTCRKRYIEEKLDGALTNVDAVVILGAGLDTRPYRLARRSTIRVFEVDQPVNIARKVATVRRVLGTVPTSVRLVAVDFERDDLARVLADNGYRGESRTFFIWEGVTQYLTEDGVRATFGFLAGAAPGSRLVFTHVQRDFIEGTNLYGAKALHRRFREKRQVWHFGLDPDEVSAFVATYGWRLIEQAGPGYFVRHYIQPAGRNITASQLEWSAFAEKL